MVTARRQLLRACIATTIAARLLAVSTPATSAPLDEARLAMKSVRYDQAQAALARLLEAGQLNRDDLVEAYMLSGAVAVVLGQRDQAEQFFQRALIINPEAALPAGSATKLTNAFAAAKTTAATRGSLRALVRGMPGAKLQIEVINDPLHFINSAVLQQPGKPDQPAVALGFANVTADATAVVLLDNRNNQLLRINRAEFIAPPTEPSDVPPPTLDPTKVVPTESNPNKVTTPTPPQAGTQQPAPLWRRWPVWAGGTGVALTVGAAFGYLAGNNQDKRDKAAASGTAFYDDVLSLDRSAKRDATIANVAFISAGVLAVTGAIVVLTAPKSARTTALQPHISNNSVGVVLVTGW